jgi:hypothetical protein
MLCAPAVVQFKPPSSARTRDDTFTSAPPCQAARQFSGTLTRAPSKDPRGHGQTLLCPFVASIFRFRYDQRFRAIGWHHTDDFVGIHVRYRDWVFQIGAILSDHIAMQQLLSGFCVLVMGMYIVHALRSETLASSPILVTILLFAFFILVLAAISSSAALTGIMSSRPSMRQGNC